MNIIRGVDGCQGGWLSLSVGRNGKIPVAQVFPDAKSLLESGPGAINAIDIPIGLSADKPRQCDVDARLLLGSRRSSVFPAPVRCSVEAASYELACAASELFENTDILSRARAEYEYRLAGDEYICPIPGDAEPYIIEE